MTPTLAAPGTSARATSPCRSGVRSVLLAIVAVLGAVAASCPAPAPLVSEHALLGVPEGKVPAGGFEMIVLLHGHGVGKEDFTDLVATLAHEGVAAIALDGPIELASGGRTWGHSFESTHAFVREQLAAFRDDERLNLARVHVGGFSRGAIHALGIAKAHPELYGGVLCISPAGSDLPTPKGMQKSARLMLVAGDQEGARMRRRLDRIEDEWRERGGEVRRYMHPGGHHFPENWSVVLVEAVRWIVRDRS